MDSNNNNSTCLSLVLMSNMKGKSTFLDSKTRPASTCSHWLRSIVPRGFLSLFYKGEGGRGGDGGKERCKEGRGSGEWEGENEGGKGKKERGWGGRKGGWIHNREESISCEG